MDNLDTLRSIYGNEPAILSSQRQRYQEAADQFIARLGPGPITFFRTPGRINLIGEHTDYNGGFVMPAALDRDVLLATRRRADTLIRVVNIEPRFVPFSFELSPEIPHAPGGDWSNYLRGAAQEISRRFGDKQPLEGMDVLVSGLPPHSVPRGAGLSSSTALSVALALALITLNHIAIKRDQLAHLCSEAEWYVGTRGGMMDQFAALLSRRDHALFLDCRPAADGQYTVRHIPLPENMQIVLLNSGVHHDNVRGEFNQRVAECKVGVQLLRRRHPAITCLRDVTDLGLDAEIDQLPDAASVSDLVQSGLAADRLAALIADHRLPADTSLSVRPRCRHVVGENRRVLAAVQALQAGHVQQLGTLMDRAHASMRDDYAASCVEVDRLVDIVREQPGVWGARITGAGWGGGVVACMERRSDNEWMTVVQEQYRQATGLHTEIFVCRPGDGASLVEWMEG